MSEKLYNCPVAFLQSLCRKFTELLVICQKEAMG